jgi:hypothetical protein
MKQSHSDQHSIFGYGFATLVFEMMGSGICVYPRPSAIEFDGFVF